MALKNRLVRSATYEHLADENGKVTPSFVEFYKVLARGGVGLIVTGLMFAQRSGKAYLFQTGIDRDECVSGLRKLTRGIHDCGKGCKVVAQLAHGGRQSYGVEETVAPSAITEPLSGKTPRAMTAGEIAEAIEGFVEGARRAKTSGFDGIQIHAAHGYLLSEFLSPFTNKRTDEYGGILENRARLVDEIFTRTREAVGADFPILIKMNVDDHLNGGIDLREATRFAERFSRLGFDAIETSGGMWEVVLRSPEELGWTPAFNPEARVDILSKDKEAYYWPYAREIKRVIDKPLILVGGIRSLDIAEQILAEGSADLIAMCRPLIHDPNLPRQWLDGTGPLTSGCISCNACTGSSMTGGVRCLQKDPLDG
jgi:2,4-dienoyl-CoA reductase-like NADH-dependent reductase (Old Yellow Enzyme family)